MVPTFDELLPLLHSAGDWESFEDDEAKLYYDTLIQLPPRSVICEIGLQNGRSTAISASIAKANQHLFVGIDPFVDPPDNWIHLMHDKIKVDFILFHMKSENVRLEMLPTLDFLLIDGDHEHPGVEKDIKFAQLTVRHGGFVAIHDYGRWYLPGVREVTDRLAPGLLEPIGIARTLTMWRKL